MFNQHKPGGHCYLNHFVINPIFSRYRKYIIREVMRQVRLCLGYVYDISTDIVLPLCLTCPWKQHAAKHQPIRTVLAGQQPQGCGWPHTLPCVVLERGDVGKGSILLTHTIHFVRDH